jgi:hypothetical protein
MKKIALLGVAALILGYFVLSSGVLPPAVQVQANRAVVVVRTWVSDLGWMMKDNRDCGDPAEMQTPYCAGKKK